MSTAVALPSGFGIDQASTEIPICELSDFILEHGRLPRLGDERAPWTYPGWLLYYVQLLEDHLGLAPRWDYWARTMQAGKLLDEPIPELKFVMHSSERSAGYKEFNKWVDIIDRDGHSPSPLRDLFDWLLFGLGVEKELPQVTDKMHEALYRGVDLGPMLQEPHDYAGTWIAMHKGRWNPHAFFPTPHSVTEMMVQMQFGTALEDTRELTVCDPCVGSGRMLLHASNYSLRLYGMDIDPLMVRATKFNGALYAPWLVKPFHESFFRRRGPATGIEQGSSLLIEPGYSVPSAPVSI